MGNDRWVNGLVVSCFYIFQVRWGCAGRVSDSVARDKLTWIIICKVWFDKFGMSNQL